MNRILIAYAITLLLGCTHHIAPMSSRDIATEQEIEQELADQKALELCRLSPPKDIKGLERCATLSTLVDARNRSQAATENFHDTISEIDRQQMENSALLNELRQQTIYLRSLDGGYR